MDYYTKARVFFYELVSPKEENKEPLARRITRIEDDWLKDRRNASEYDLQGKVKFEGGIKNCLSLRISSIIEQF